jgi:hypothetical protein
VKSSAILSIVASVIMFFIFICGAYVAVNQSKVQESISTSTANVQDDDVVKQKVYAMNTGNEEIYVRIHVNKAWNIDDKKVFRKNQLEIKLEETKLCYVNNQWK